MFVLLLEVMILKVMGNHAYSFNEINSTFVIFWCLTDIMFEL